MLFSARKIEGRLLACAILAAATIFLTYMPNGVIQRAQQEDNIFARVGLRRMGARLVLPAAAFVADPALPPLLPRTPSPHPSLPTVAICAIVRDQIADLTEWLAWHAGVGVSHFYLYDHASAPPLDPASPPLAPFFDAGLITLITAPGDAGLAHHSGRAQMWAYDDCLAVFGRGVARRGAHSPPPGVDAGAWERVVSSLRVASPSPPPPPPLWLAFIDIDEFIMPTGEVASDVAHGAPSPDAIPSAVAAFSALYPAAGAWALNWKIFGSSGWGDRPKGGVLASYTACLQPDDPENTHVKSMVRVGGTALRVGSDPHHFLYRSGPGALNGRGQAVPGGVAAALGPAAYEGLALHHYLLKSRAEFVTKMARGSGDGTAKDWSLWESVENRSVSVCEGGAEMGRVVARRGRGLGKLTGKG